MKGKEAKSKAKQERRAGQQAELDRMDAEMVKKPGRGQQQGAEKSFSTRIKATGGKQARGSTAVAPAIDGIAMPAASKVHQPGSWREEAKVSKPSKKRDWDEDEDDYGDEEESSAGTKSFLQDMMKDWEKKSGGDDALRNNLSNKKRR